MSLIGDPIVIAAILAGVALIGAGGLLWKRKRNAPSPSISDQLPSRWAQALSPTQSNLSRLIKTLGMGDRLDSASLDRLEETLITSDFGVKATRELLHSLPQNLNSSHLQAHLHQKCVEIFTPPEEWWTKIKQGPKPYVVMVVGVNGVGKTTTIGKLAFQAKSKGLSVLLAAGDTFRAAASQQLTVWAERAQVPIVARGDGADPASVLFDSLQSALAKKVDIVICDTAGRLHSKQGLMDELSKCIRVMKKVIPEAPHQTLLVVDATTGQNALRQAESFHQIPGGLSGVVLTKMDGTAKGGIVVAIQKELAIPVLFVGLGEKIEDLETFDPKTFVDAILPLDPTDRRH